MASFNHDLDHHTLWHICGHGREVHPAGRTYWFDRSGFEQGGSVVQLTVSGRIIFRDQGRDPSTTHDVGPGTIMLFNYGESHAYGQPAPLDEPYACRWISLFGAGVREHIGALIAQHGPVHPVGMDHPIVDQLDRLIGMVDPGQPAAPTELASSIFHFVMNLHDRANLRQQEKLAPVEQAIRCILQRPHQPMSLKEIAAHFGVSREHLSREFARAVGRSAHDVLAEAKCRRALSLLNETRLPVAEVARQAGYANPHSLARHVRRATGQSPTAYRFSIEIDRTASNR